MTAVLIAYLATFMLSFTWSGFLSTAFRSTAVKW